MKPGVTGSCFFVREQEESKKEFGEETTEKRTGYRKAGGKEWDQQLSSS